MSATKSATAARRSGVAYGAAKAPRTSRGSARPRSAVVPRTKIGVRSQTARSSGGSPGQSDQRRRRRASRLVDRGVGEHDAAQLVTMPQRPAEGDRAAPVVGDRDDRAVDAEGLARRPRSSTRCASRRTASVRSE